MISFFGAFLGLIIGLIVCWLQIKYGIVKFPSSGSFIINSYPVEIKAVDVVFVLITVLVIGYLAAWYPVKYIIKRYLPESQFVDS
jgi:lipoprotein-releasing system permease protein